MKRQETYGHKLAAGTLLMISAVVGGCSPTQPEELVTTRGALEEPPLEAPPPPPPTSDIALRILGVRVPGNSGTIPNNFSAVRMKMRTSIDDSPFIGTQDMFLCGTAVGSSTGGSGILCNQGGVAKYHEYPAFANSFLLDSPRPQVYLREETVPSAPGTAAIDVEFSLSPGPGSGFGGESLFSSSGGRFRVNVDLTTGDVEPAFGSPAGAVCGLRRRDGTSFGSCARTCPDASGLECRQDCVMLQAAGLPWEVCYEVDVVGVTTNRSRVPCIVQNILYEAPGDASRISMGAKRTIGSRTAWRTTTTNSTILGVEGGSTILMGTSEVEVGWSSINGGAIVEETSHFTGLFVDSFANLPNHQDNDQFLLACGAVSTREQRSDGTVTTTIDLPSATFVRLRTNQLRALAQSPRTAEHLNIVPEADRQVLDQFLSPQGAQAALNLNPFLTGEDITLNPMRFERADPPHIQIQGPTAMNQGPAGVELELGIVRGQETDKGTGYNVRFSTGVKYKYEIRYQGVEVGGITTDLTEQFELEYESVKTDSEMEEVTYGLEFATSTACVGMPATIDADVWFDNAFGSYLLVNPVVFNPCVQQPFQTMSFENLDDWQVQSGGSATLSNQIVSGAHSFSISAVGWTPLVSRPLSSAQLRSVAKSADLSKMSFALRIPTSQPNPYWIGAAQMYITAPSANIYNAYMGQVELTPLPRGQFVRLGYTIPEYARHVLTGNHEDVTFTVVLNVNAGTTGWLVDDLVLGQ